MDSKRHVRRAARSFVGPLALVAAVVVVFATAASGAAAERSTPDNALLRAYQPVLVFHPDELFRPTTVDSFVKDSELERSLGLDPTLLPFDAYWQLVDDNPHLGKLPGPTTGTLFRLNQVGCDADAPLAGRDCYAAAWEKGAGHDAVYGRVVRTPSAIVLQYWLFYYDNPMVLPPIPYGSAQLTFWQSHEGDWEVVNVILDLDENPVQAAYSEHCSGLRKAWASVQKWPVASTHPVAYVALGSHANYFAPGPAALGGAIPLSPACIPAFVPAPLRPYVVDQVLDGSAVGAVVGPPGTGKGVEHASIRKIEGEDWASFAGRWGESEYFFTPIAMSPPGLPPVPANTAVPMGLAPASPPYQANWQPATLFNWPTS